jgi:hypothetical protein
MRWKICDIDGCNNWVRATTKPAEMVICKNHTIIEREPVDWTCGNSQKRIRAF